MENMNSSVLKASDLCPKVCSGSISVQLSLEVSFSFISNCEANLLQDCSTGP